MLLLIIFLVAKSVLARKHTLENQKLKVSACASAQFYDNRVLIEGLKQTTTEDCLSDFLEVKADCIVSDTHFSRTEDRCKAIVTTDETVGRY